MYFSKTNDEYELPLYKDPSRDNMIWNEAINELMLYAGKLSYVILKIFVGLKPEFNRFMSDFIELKSFDWESRFW